MRKEKFKMGFFLKLGHKFFLHCLPARAHAPTFPLFAQALAAVVYPRKEDRTPRFM